VNPALILYGSKARGDARLNSDVDLIFASDDDELGSPSQANGVSVHRYPKGWLEKESVAGNLFAYHVAFEDIGIAALVLKMLIERDWTHNFDARRRFFWALRTVLIGASAEAGTPIFSAESMERLSAIAGLAALVQERDIANFDQCRALGTRVLERYPPAGLIDLQGQSLRDYLVEWGGIARDSVRVIEEAEAIADVGLAIYL
jgi:predicted nucleotidyltransferase